MTLGGNLAQAAKCLVSSNDFTQAITLLRKRNDIQEGVKILMITYLVDNLIG